MSCEAVDYAVNKDAGFSGAPGGDDYISALFGVSGLIGHAKVISA